MRRIVLYYTIWALLILPLSAGASEPVDLAVSINQLRYERGLPYLSGDWTLDMYAQAHAERMAAVGYLYHSNIERLLGPWQRVGENVGVGDTIWHLLGAFQGSPSHADNLFGYWTHLGVGLAVDASGRMWVAIVVTS